MMEKAAMSVVTLRFSSLSDRCACRKSNGKSNTDSSSVSLSTSSTVSISESLSNKKSASELSSTP